MRESLSTTDNSSIYNKLLKRKIAEEKGLCIYCWKKSGVMWGGENYWIKDKRKKDRSWKKFRKKQYKED